MTCILSPSSRQHHPPHEAGVCAAAAGGPDPRHLQLPLHAPADLAAVVRIARLLTADLAADPAADLTADPAADLTADLTADLATVDGLGRLVPLALGGGAVEHLPRPVQPQR